MAVWLTLLCPCLPLPLQSFERQYGKDKDVLGENLRVLHAKCDAGPPGIWKVASQVAATAEDVVVLKARTAEAQVGWVGGGLNTMHGHMTCFRTCTRCTAPGLALNTCGSTHVLAVDVL